RNTASSAATPGKAVATTNHFSNRLIRLGSGATTSSQPASALPCPPASLPPTRETSGGPSGTHNRPYVPTATRTNPTMPPLRHRYALAIADTAATNAPGVLTATACPILLPELLQAQAAIRIPQVATVVPAMSSQPGYGSRNHVTDAATIIDTPANAINA